MKNERFGQKRKVLKNERSNNYGIYIVAFLSIINISYDYNMILVVDLMCVY